MNRIRDLASRILFLALVLGPCLLVVWGVAHCSSPDREGGEPSTYEGRCTGYGKYRECE